MDSYQHQNSLQPPTQNPYEFILNPPTPPKQKRLSTNNHSLAFILAFIIGGAVLLMIILAIAASLLGGTKVQTNDLVSLTQTQNELVRVAQQGTASAVQQATVNLAITMQYSIRTQQQQTLGFLAQKGKKVGDKELALKQDATTDQQFTTAKATSTFDKVFAQVMQTQLTAYANTLKGLFGKSTDTTEKELLSNYYEQTQLLIGQIPYTQQNTDATTQ